MVRVDVNLCVCVRKQMPVVVISSVPVADAGSILIRVLCVRVCERDAGIFVSFSVLPG